MNRRDFIKGAIAGTVSGVLINDLGELRVVTPRELYLEPISTKPLDKAMLDSLADAQKMMDRYGVAIVEEPQYFMLTERQSREQIEKLYSASIMGSDNV